MARRMIAGAEKLQKLANLIDVSGNKVEFGGDVEVDGTLSFNGLPLVYQGSLNHQAGGQYKGDKVLLEEGLYITKIIADGVYCGIGYLKNGQINISGTIDLNDTVIPKFLIEPSYDNQDFFLWCFNPDLDTVEIDGLSTVNVELYKLF